MQLQSIRCQKVELKTRNLDATLPDWAFRKLSVHEEQQFRQWARENATPEHLAKAAIYHPVIRDEWQKMGVR